MTKGEKIKMKEKLRLIQQAIRNNQGFTFVELLIVITILAILSTLAISRFGGALDSTKIKAAKAKIALFETNLERYYIMFDQYPTTEEGLQKLAEAEVIKNTKDALIDPWGNPYNYRYPGIFSKGPEIWSFGADGKEGGEGVNADINNWE